MNWIGSKTLRLHPLYNLNSLLYVTECCGYHMKHTLKTKIGLMTGVTRSFILCKRGNSSQPDTALFRFFIDFFIFGDRLKFHLDDRGPMLRGVPVFCFQGI